MKTGVELIAEERARVINGEGFGAYNDDQYQHNELIRASEAYLDAARTANIREDAAKYHSLPPLSWPFEMSWWKPSADPVRNLVKAGQFIAAEIDRLNRKKENGK